MSGTAAQLLDLNSFLVQIKLQLRIWHGFFRAYVEEGKQLSVICLHQGMQSEKQNTYVYFAIPIGGKMCYLVTTQPCSAQLFTYLAEEKKKENLNKLS